MRADINGQFGYENSGYSIVEPMDRVFELLDEIRGGAPAAT
jgi:hypothetical protein